MNEFQANPILSKLATCVSALLIVSLVLYVPQARAQVHVAPPQGLRIMILSGEGALNNIEARTAREPVVQVQDQNHKPVAGAAVLFTIHGGSNGAGGTFQNKSNTFSTVTNADGIAVATGFHPNNAVGAWQVSVSASFGALTAAAVINENNVLPEAPQQQLNTQPSTGPAAPGALPNQPASNSATSSHGYPGHGPARPLHWFTTTPGIVVTTAVIVATVVSVVVLTRSGNATRISPGQPSVGAPAAQGAAGFSIHFGKR